MGIRKDQAKLTNTEKARFVSAVSKMKADNVAPYNYDKFVTIHATALTDDPNTNPAHMGPGFFPWHRYFILKFERDLQAADMALGNDGQITLPYWNWTFDNADTPGPGRGRIWRSNFMGGFGVPVTTGPFRDGVWTLAPPGGGPLVRVLGRTAIQNFASPSLPTLAQVLHALTFDGYDCDPWDTGVAAGPSVASPSSPHLTGTGVGVLAAGEYSVAVTYVNARGETRPSVSRRICLGAGCTPANTNNAITVDSPPSQPSASGYNLYLSPPGGAAGTETRQGGTTAIGTAVTVGTLTAGPPRPTINTTGSFRNALEGWIPDPTDPQLHNRVHMWVGGSMAPGTSPDDPLFFLHHCNVDRLWALWQFRHPGQNYPLNVPNVGGVPGTRPHGLNDPMPPWIAAPELERPIDVLNHTALGYTYDTDPVGMTIRVGP